MLRALHAKKGFTLIELMIVVAIIGILAAIAIPNFLRFQAKSKQSEAKTNLGAIGTTAESYRVEKDTYVISSISDLGWAPQGTVRYSYWYDVSGTATMFPLAGALWSDGVAATPAATPCVRDTAPTTAVTATALGFTSVAKGQVDTDAYCDEWSYTQARQLNNDMNDVTN
jgi:type IV pilus assembly protein PilA